MLFKNEGQEVCFLTGWEFEFDVMFLYQFSAKCLIIRLLRLIFMSFISLCISLIFT